MKKEVDFFIVLICCIFLFSPVFVSGFDISVRAEHPRLLLRDSVWDGPSVEGIKRYCAESDNRCDFYIDKTGGIVGYAMDYLLNGDVESAKVVKNDLLSFDIDCGSFATETSDLSGYAVAFDWIYGYQGFSASDKNIVNKKIQDCAWQLKSSLDDEGAHLFHGRTQLSAALMIAALSQDGDAALVDAASDKFLVDSLDAWHYLGGAWPEGMMYADYRFSSSGLGRGIGDALLSVYSAADFDVFDYVDRVQDGWLEDFGLFNVYMQRPDDEWSRFGDVSSPKLLSKGEQSSYLMMIGHYYNNSYVSRLARDFSGECRDDVDCFVYASAFGVEDDSSSFCRESDHFLCGLYLKISDYFDKKKELKFWSGLPSAVVFGKDSLGYAFIKSDWSDSQTFIQFVAGDWFTGHQHFASGSFTLFKNSPLAVDSGVYSEWGSDHRENYYSRTVAHNALLICQPGEVFNSVPSVVLSNDCGQRTLTRGGQLVVDLDQHLAELNEGVHKDTGDLVNFVHSDFFDYINSDITRAYNSVDYSYYDNIPKVSSVTRQLVYLRDLDVLVVFDRINSTDPSYVKKWVLHSVKKPLTLSESLVDGSSDSGVLETRDKEYLIDNEGDSLFVATLLPKNSKTLKIGGSGYEFYSDGKNRAGSSKYGLHNDVGSWRVEVMSEGSSYFDTFLHLLAPGVKDLNYVLVEGENFQGVLVEDSLILFSKFGEPVSYDALSFNNVKISDFMIVNLYPSKKYLFSIDGIAYEGVSSSEGVLYSELGKKVSSLELR